MFKDRNDAAKQLSEKLEKFKNRNAVVVAIPRGGVPLGYYIAWQLGLPLELVLSKKIGHPSNKEYAIGAVTLHDELLDYAAQSVSHDYLQSEIKRVRTLLMNRQMMYYGSIKPISLKDKVIILVDDGIATGYTLRSCVEMLKKHHPAKIIVAIPVAPYHTAQMLKIQPSIDEFICLSEPTDFYAVGQFYENFNQVSDLEVMQMMKKSKRDLSV